MDFKSTKGIYQQIADNICDRIISGELAIGSKLPSVREQAATIGVNQNTIMRTYAELQRDEIIINKRGIGYFISDTAPEKILQNKRQYFFEHSLPEFLRQVKLLKISEDELSPILKQLKENSNENI